MKKYKWRVLGLTLFWRYFEAENKEEVFDKMSSRLEEKIPEIPWKDTKDDWEIKEVITESE